MQYFHWSINYNKQTSSNVSYRPRLVGLLFAKDFQSRVVLGESLCFLQLLSAAGFYPARFLENFFFLKKAIISVTTSCGNILTSKFKHARRPTESKHTVDPPSVNAS